MQTVYRASLYRRRDSMIQRCHNKNGRQYKDYGGRGITVCKEWRDNPNAFIDYCLTIGFKPELDLNRINNNGNYEPGNVRFVQKIINQRNKRRNKRNKSGCSGVFYNNQSKRYTVTVGSKYFGSFKKFQDAVFVRVTTARKLGYSGS